MILRPRTIPGFNAPSRLQRSFPSPPHALTRPRMPACNGSAPARPLLISRFKKNSPPDFPFPKTNHQKAETIRSQTETETEAEAGVEALGLAGGLEDSQASKCKCEDTGWVGGSRRLEVLDELEAGEGEALVVGGHGGLEAGERREHVVR